MSRLTLTGAGGGVAVFNPGAISSCALWLESKEGVTDVATKVSVWDDTISGATNQFTQTTDANRPTLTADIFGTGVSGLTPDGSNDTMGRADTSALDALATDQWMFIFRVKTNASITTGTKTYISKYDGNGYYHGESYKGGSQKWWMAITSGGTYTQWYGSTTVAADTTYTVEMHSTNGNLNGDGWQIYVGEGATTPSAETMASNDTLLNASGENTAEIKLFSRGGTGTFCFENFGCVGFFNAIPSASDLALLRTYISDNYP
jgi:hypothetical protein